MNKKQILAIVAGAVTLIAFAVVVVVLTGSAVRETPPAPISPSKRDKAFVQAPRPEPGDHTRTQDGPDLPVQPVPKAGPQPGPEPEVAQALAEPEPAAEATEEERLYYEALVFKDEALVTFPVHTVDVHIPESLVPKRWDTAGRPIPYPNPKKNEIWIRVKPGKRASIREIMAQTADLYRQYAGETQADIRVINWLGFQPQSVVTYGPDGNEVRN